MEVNVKELQKKEIEIFLEFIKICDENHLTWFVLGGTALGTVRHKGFIPWDDDIDVALPRKDYEKFLDIAEHRLPSNMFLQFYKTDENYPHTYAKIRKKDTTFIEKTVSSIKMCHGIYIDIFPLDGYPKYRFNRIIFHVKEKILKIAVGQAFEVENIDESFAKKILKNIIKKAITYKNAVRNLDLLYKSYSYEISEKIANFGGAWGKKEIMSREIFGEGIQAEFEGIKVIVPKKAHEYLTLLYGDYITPPPPEKRFSHHFCTVIDLDNPYTKYTDDKF